MTRFVREILADLLDDREVNLVVSGLDLVGDIALMKIPRELRPKAESMALRLLQHLSSVHTVARIASAVTGRLRRRRIEILAGERKTLALHREHGCRFWVDIAQTYFSPRLAEERRRVAGQLRDDEVVVNLFGGVGPFSIVGARLKPRTIHYCVDINRVAHTLCVANVELNRVAERVVPVWGAAEQVGSTSLRGLATRVLMPLPETAHRYAHVAKACISPNGAIVHFYTHVSAMDRLGASERALQRARRAFGEELKPLLSRVVRDVGPRWYEVVVDLSGHA